MKTVSKISLFIVILSGLFIACNKDRKAVKSIQGIWYLTEITTNGNASEPITDSICITYSFNEDKIKKGDVGDGRIRISIKDMYGEWVGQGFIHPFTYRIYEKGTKIELTIEWMKDIVTIEKVEIIDADLLELTGSDRMIISYKEGYDFGLIYKGKVLVKKESGVTIKETFLHSQGDKYNVGYEGC